MYMNEICIVLKNRFHGTMSSDEVKTKKIHFVCF